jgi:lipopolysaccharide heptosyltransferase I
MTIEQSTEQPNKILIVKPSSLGDIFHTFPAVSLLAEAWPECEFHWLVAPQFASVIKYSTSVSKTIIFPRKQLGSVKHFLPAFLKLRRELRQENYAKIIDFQGLLRSAFFAKIAKSSQYIGFATPREPLAKIFYNQTITIPDNCIHAVERNLSMAEQICGLKKNVQELPPLPSLPQFSTSAKALLKSKNCDRSDKFIGIALGARWESKRWPNDFFITIIQQLLEQVPTGKIILLGDSACSDVAANILKTVNHVNLISLVNKTSLSELIEVINCCELLICNDSGPMHIAAAAKKPIIAFFGPTLPERTGPYGAEYQIFQRKLDCIGCLKRYCPQGDMQCHKLNIDEIITATINYLTP